MEIADEVDEKTTHICSLITYEKWQKVYNYHSASCIYAKHNELSQKQHFWNNTIVIFLTLIYVYFRSTFFVFDISFLSTTFSGLVNQTKFWMYPELHVNESIYASKSHIKLDCIWKWMFVMNETVTQVRKKYSLQSLNIYGIFAWYRSDMKTSITL